MHVKLRLEGFPTSLLGSLTAAATLAAAVNFSFTHETILTAAHTRIETVDAQISCPSAKKVQEAQVNHSIYSADRRTH
jgi:hypothetical protein